MCHRVLNLKIFFKMQQQLFIISVNQTSSIYRQPCQVVWPPGLPVRTCQDGLNLIWNVYHNFFLSSDGLFLNKTNVYVLHVCLWNTSVKMITAYEALQDTVYNLLPPHCKNYCTPFCICWTRTLRIKMTATDPVFIII